MTMAQWVMAKKYSRDFKDIGEYVEYLRSLPECDAPEGYCEVITLDVHRERRKQLTSPIE